MRIFVLGLIVILAVLAFSCWLSHSSSSGPVTATSVPTDVPAPSPTLDLSACSNQGHGWFYCPPR